MLSEANKGLRGIVAGESKIGFVDGVRGTLSYRGYRVEDLAKKASFEETAYLLLYGKLPNQKELKTFSKKISEKRKLPKEILKMIPLFPKKAHPMEVLQTVIAALGSFYPDTLDQAKPTVVLDRSLELMGQFPTVVAATWRALQGKKMLPPNNHLDHCSNFLYMLTGKEPDAEGAKIFDSCLTLHAEHSFNASTFTARVVVSSLSSLHAAVSAAVGSLYGPLHGGANEHVLEMIDEIKVPEKAEAWVMQKLANKEKVMGMGHPIYQVKDPRSYVLEEMLARYADIKKSTREYEILKKIETVMNREMAKKEKTVAPNVDFFSGALYRLLGIHSRLFTPIFAIARISGWCAHAVEQLEDNRIFRPDCEYVGPHDLSFIPINQR